MSPSISSRLLHFLRCFAAAGGAASLMHNQRADSLVLVPTVGSAENLDLETGRRPAAKAHVFTVAKLDPTKRSLFRRFHRTMSSAGRPQGSAIA